MYFYLFCASLLLVAEEDDVVGLDEAVQLSAPQQLLQELVLLLRVLLRKEARILGKLA